MPINQPIKDRKVAPNSLAFPSGSRGGRSVSGAGGYQQVVQNSVTNIIINADSETQVRDRRAAALADRDAEYRAKAWVGDWHRVIDWDIGTNIYVTNNVWHPITFSNEAMRAMGAYYTSAGNGTWFWTIPPDWDGTWFLGGFFSINVAVAAAIQQAQLGIVVNGTLRTVLDRADIEMAGDNAGYMRDVILRGWRNVGVNVGDIVTLGIQLTGAAGSDTYTNPISVTGYISGHRTMCGDDHIINSQDDCNGYVFT